MSLADTEAQDGQRSRHSISPTTNERLPANVITTDPANRRDATNIYTDDNDDGGGETRPTGKEGKTVSLEGGVTNSLSGFASAAGDTVPYLNLLASSPETPQPRHNIVRATYVLRRFLSLTFMYINQA